MSGEKLKASPKHFILKYLTSNQTILSTKLALKSESSFNICMNIIKTGHVSDENRVEHTCVYTGNSCF